MKIAIIGAGCSGIAALKQLLESGITDITCFEQNDRVGGNWIFTSESSHSSVTETTHIISSKKLSEYSDFPMPAYYPDYPSHSQVLAYFESYAEQFGLKKYIRFNTKVDKVTRTEAGKWELYVNRAELPELFDFLIVSNGHHSVPRHPAIEGKFTGEYLHSHDFKSGLRFAGKKVLVIGGGNSACDCAVECSRVAAFVAISMRRPHYIVPKFMMGKPTDTFNDSLRYVPEFLAEKLRRASLKLQIGNYEDYGLKTPNFPLTKDHPTVNSELLYMLRHGKVVPKQGISKIDGDEVTFVDGSKENYDTIIAATGYKMATPFFDPEFLDYSEADCIPLYLRMFHPVYHNLIFIGLVQPQGSVWPLSESQSKLAAAYIKGQWHLPKNVLALAKKEADLISQEFVKSKRHTVEVHFKLYLDRLSKEIKKTV